MSLRKNTADNTQSYFDYTLKSNWQHLIFYIILALLVIVLPTVVTVSDFSERAFNAYEYKLRDADELMIVSAVLTFVTSCGIAVFAGMSAVSYVNSKQAVGCFHSFPVTRQTIYFTETGVRALYFLVSVGIAVVISWGLLELNMPHSDEVRTFYIQMLLMSVLGFALFYAITLFAAGLTGTALLRFLMLCLVVALPIALYALVCAAVSLGMPDVDIDPYLEFNFIKWLCPVTFVADIILGLAGENPGTVQYHFGLNVVLMLLPAAAFYFGGLLLHLKRRSETSGTSIIWRPVFTVIKYAVMFVATLCGMLFFGAMSGEEGAWFFFGGLCGLVLSFMLANVILYRSVRSMFKGVKGLCVMAVVMVIFSVFTVYDAAGLNEHMWSAGNTKSLEIELNGVDVKYTDREDIEAIVPLLQEYMNEKEYGDYYAQYAVAERLYPVDEGTAEDVRTYLDGYRNEKGGYYDEWGNWITYEDVYYDSVYYPETSVSFYENGIPVVEEIATTEYYQISTSNETYDLRWGQFPKVGIPSYKQVWTYLSEHTAPLFDYIISTEEYAAEINSFKDTEIENVGEVGIQLFDAEMSYYGYEKTVNVAQEIFAKLVSVYSFDAETRANSPLIGRINIWANEYHRIPVYAADVELINLAAEYLGLDLHFTTEQDVIDYLAEEADAMFLVEMETGRIVSLNETDRRVIFRKLPFAGRRSSVVPNMYGGKEYAAVVVNGFKDGTAYETYTAPLLPAYEEAAAKLFD